MDHFTTQKKLDELTDRAIGKIAEVTGDPDPDDAREDLNDEALGEFGVRPAAARRAARRPDLSA